MTQATVLIVDDEADVRHMVSYVFRRCGYRVHTAADGAQALAIAESILPDIVITDVVMPRMTGTELARALRAGERTAHVPILMISAHDRADLRAGDGALADAYLVKPVELAALVGRAEALIAAGRARGGGQRDRPAETLARRTGPEQ